MISLLQQKYQSFWHLVQDEFRRAGEPFHFGSRTDRNWVTTRFIGANSGSSAGIGKCELAFAFDETGRLKCEINLQHTYEFNKCVFDHLFADKDAIEREFGRCLVWRRADDKIRSQLKIYCDNSSLNARESWEYYVCWLFMNAFKYRNILTHRILNVASNLP